MIKLKYLLTFLLLSTCSNTYALTDQEAQDIIKHERWQARVIDIMTLTLIAHGIGEHAIEGNGNVETGQIKILISAALGITSWAAGELCESIYKTVYEKIKGKKLRQAMGQTKLGDFTIDHQRLVRRTISMAVLIALLYVLSNNPTIFSVEE